MQIHLSPRHLQLTASIHQAVAMQVGQLEDLGADILGAHVVLISDVAAKKGKRHTVKVHLAISGTDIHAEHTEDDLYIALERVTEKAARQLRKRKTALNDKRRQTTQKAAERSRSAGELPRSIRKGLKTIGKAAQL